MRILLAAIALASPVPALAQQAAEDATRAAIARVEKLNPRLNAVIALDPDAIAQARASDRNRMVRGPLYAMPILLKDNIEAKGRLPTTAGSLALKDNVTDRDAPLVSRLRAAGAVILGKANLSEWANIRSEHSISGWSAVGGQTRNPHALNRNTCGSSSGSGAAVAAGMVDAAIGTETDGSITCPASINGIVGLKPTVGLVSRTRIVPISHSQDTAGPMAKDVATAARVLAAIAGSDPEDAATAEADAHVADYSAALRPQALRGTRIGVMRFAAGWSKPVDALFDRALGLMKAQGATLVEIAEFPDRDRIGRDELTVLLTELKAGLNAYLAATPPAVKTRTLKDVIAFNQANAATELALFDQGLFERAEATRGLDDPAYRAARAVSFQLAGPSGIDRLLAEHDVIALVAPTMPPAWMIDAVNGDQIAGGGASMLAAVSGYPHLSLPMGAVKRLPIGLSIIGPKWSEATLLGLGYAYEQAAKIRVTPALLPAIEDAPEVAERLAPTR